MGEGEGAGSAAGRPYTGSRARARAVDRRLARTRRPRSRLWRPRVCWHRTRWLQSERWRRTTLAFSAHAHAGRLRPALSSLEQLCALAHADAASALDAQQAAMLFAEASGNFTVAAARARGLLAAASAGAPTAGPLGLQVRACVCVCLSVCVRACARARAHVCGWVGG
ncbi:hypothetical protein T492DRAFT_178967 [Pavlovales sp. CCMP2436]|nr:hypothetical protein T492DRAFT_178967 [Pavlovales sp. CCMP2436]